MFKTKIFYWHSTHPDKENKKAISAIVKQNDQLNQVVEKGKVIREKMYMTTKKDTSDEPLMFVVGVPLMKDNKPTGGVYLYQSLSEIEEPAQYTD